LTDTYYFHPRVHEQWGDQSLHFILMNFRVSYDPPDLRDALADVFEKHVVTSQATYELIGRFDLMLRIWIAPNKLFALRADLEKELAPLSPETVGSIPVTSTIRHWPWGTIGQGRARRGSLHPVDGAVLSEVPGRAQLDQLNKLTSGRATEVDATFIESWKRAKVITERPGLPGSGIRLVTLVSGQFALEELVTLELRLARILDELDPNTFTERSLYRAEGMVPFLIMYRMNVADFGEIRDGIISGIQRNLLGRARTTTYPIVRQELVPFSDAIAPSLVSQSASRPSIEELLAQDEDERLEVKATAFAPLEPWLSTGAEPVEAKGFFDKSILRAVVALLNSSGGTVVIGALEDVKVRGISPEQDQRLEPLPVIGQYVAVGLVDPSFVERGWDHYARRIIDLLDQRIAPKPVARGVVAVERAALAGKDFCLLRVEPDDRWYYGRPDTRTASFFVRSGARSIELLGMDADDYKTKHNRRR
jgi:hypothetical protein